MICIEADDFLDPNNWKPCNHEHRIYADDAASIYVIVSAIDYAWLCQWRWTLHNPRAYERTGQLYLKRVITEFTMPEGPKYISPLSGKLVRNQHRIQRARFIHQEIMLRTGIPQPTPEHREVDHRNRRTIDCTRDNLKWATRSEQVASANLGIVRGQALVNRKLRENVQARGPDRPGGGDASL